MRFALNDSVIDVTPNAPDQTVLDLLRTDLGHCGTKEGCASGDCGACTVILGQRTDDGVVYETINACIAPAPILAGGHLITVEGLASADALHPAQQAMVDCHGAQCGFCTPGFVMSLAALYDQVHDPVRDGEAPAHEALVESISGNLCRCTGYRPILDAAAQMCAQSAAPPLEALCTLPETAGDPVDGYLRPSDRASLDAILDAHPDARLIAGGTDLMLEHTQALADLPMLVDVSVVTELNVLEDDGAHWLWGASVPLSWMQAFFADRLPDLAELLTRYGSPQIRHRATLGGSLGTASPIGDLSPVLQVLDATVLIGRSDGTTRELPIADFHLGYRSNALTTGEYVVAVRVPIPRAEDRVHVRKYSKRFEDDISSVLGAARLRVVGEAITEVRLAFGGIAATPCRIPELEALVASDAAGDAARLRGAIADAVHPLDDVRASADYRRALVAAFVEQILPTGAPS